MKSWFQQKWHRRKLNRFYTVAAPAAVNSTCFAIKTVVATAAHHFWNSCYHLLPVKHECSPLFQSWPKPQIDNFAYRLGKMPENPMPANYLKQRNHLNHDIGNLFEITKLQKELILTITYTKLYYRKIPQLFGSHGAANLIKQSGYLKL